AGERRDGGHPLPELPRALARTGAAGIPGTVRAARVLAAGGAASLVSRGADRGGSRARATCRAGGRARRARTPPSASRAPPGSADAGAVPVGAPYRGTRELPGIPAVARRRGRD